MGEAKELPVLYRILAIHGANIWPATGYAISGLLGLMTFTVTMGSSIVSPAIVNMQLYFGVRRIVAVLSVSLYVLGLALGTLLLAPLSDKYGRNNIYRPSWLCFAMVQIPIALSGNITQFLVFRFLGGLFGSPATTVVAGSLTDMWEGDDIDIPMAFVLFSAFLGPVVGPISGGYIVQLGPGGNLESWRWTIWTLLIMATVVGLNLIWVPETGLIKTRACPSTIRAMTSPVRLLADPILFLMTTYLSFIYGILFLYFGAYPYVFGLRYGWKQGPTGLAFLGIGIGILFSLPTAFLGNNYRVSRRRMQCSGTYTFRCHTQQCSCPDMIGCHPPEEHLLFAILASVLAPVSVFWFSWAQFSGTHWAVPVLSGIPFGWSMITLFICILRYLGEVYQNDPTTCMSSTSLVRYLFACGFPLFTASMYEKMGAEWAGTLIGCLLVLFSPTPAVFYFYGARIRASCKAICTQTS